MVGWRNIALCSVRGANLAGLSVLLRSLIEALRTMTKNLSTTILALCILMAVSLGCRSISDRIKENLEPDPAPVTGTTSPGESTAASGSSQSGIGDLSAKTNLYISKCVNQYSNSIMRSYGRYRSWLKDPKAGPTGKERLVYGLYEVTGDGSDCESAINEANASEPDMPAVEQAADKYLPALKEAVAQVRSVYTYYDQEDYKDDGFEKGRAAHPALMAAFEAFEVANAEFTSQVDELEDTVAQQRLEEYRKDPSKKFAFAVTDFNIKSKKAMNYVSRTDYGSLSADTIQSHAEEVDAAATAMKDAATDKMFATSYFSAADNFIKATKDLMRRVRDKKPFNSTERGWLGTPAGWMVEGSPDKVVHEYNSLVRSRSFLRY